MEILKTRRAKEYRMKSIRINFLSETKEVRRKWNDSEGAERKQLSTKNSMSSKTILQN